MQLLDGTYLGLMTLSRPQMRTEPSCPANAQFDDKEGDGSWNGSVGHCDCDCVCVCVSSCTIKQVKTMVHTIMP